MTDKNLHVLNSPAFLIGLLLLVANDFVFKGQFHNEFTGKLSDFAGLFVFSLFWIALFPRQRAFICVSTAVLFVFWKSAYSQSLIDGWNRLPFFGIQRTVDYSDLWALVVVPFAYGYRNTRARVHVQPRLLHAIAIISLVAFTATSFRHKSSYNTQYHFQMSRKQLLERMSRLPREPVTDSFEEKYVIIVSFDSCTNRATLSLTEQGHLTVITLHKLEDHCPSKPDPDDMRQYFEKEFIDKLREEPVIKSTKVINIHSTLPDPPNTPSP